MSGPRRRETYIEPTVTAATPGWLLLLAAVTVVMLVAASVIIVARALS